MKNTIQKAFSQLGQALQADYKRALLLVLVFIVASVKPALGEQETLFLQTENLQTQASIVAEATAKPATVVTAIVTAYSSTVGQTDDTPTIMASGKTVYEGAVACPRRLPFGTKVKIGTKVYTCEDRLAKKFDDRFDIWQPSTADALRHGVKTEKIEIL